MKKYIQRSGWGMGLALAGLLWVTAAVQPAQGAYYGLIVGINRYRTSYIPANKWLNACVNDAIAFRATLLADTNRWKSSRIYLQRDSAATESVIKRRLRTRAASLGRGDAFVYYQSSHGGRRSGRSCYLCTYSSTFMDTELGRELARFRSSVKIFVIIDACNSAGMFKSGKGWEFADNVLRAYKAEGAKMGDKTKAMGWNIAFMTAADYNQTSAERAGHGYYTRYLVQACKQPKKADRFRRNGYYSFWEAHAYSKPRAAAARINGTQTAQHRNYNQLRRYAMVRVQIKPPIPIGPTGSTSGRPLFTWNEVDGAKYYGIQIFNAWGRLIVNQKWIHGTSWRPGFTLANGNYRWRVRAYSYANFPSKFCARLSYAVNPSGAYIRRATLTWGSKPRDLDSWLVTPTGARIGYSSKGSQGSAPFAQLDVDDTTSYGPENVSIYQYTPSGSGVYKYYVHNYSGEGSIAGARVSVQSATRVIHNFTCPAGSGRYWYVFYMTSWGTVRAVNRVVSSPP